MSEALRTCPFCGGDPLDLGDGYYCCDNDDCAGVSLDCTKDKWNTRHIPEGYALINVDAVCDIFIKYHELNYPANNEPYRVEHFRKAMIAAAQEGSE